MAAGDAVAEGEGFAGGGAAVAFFKGEFAHAGVEEPCALGRLIVFACVGGGEVAIGEAPGRRWLRLVGGEGRRRSDCLYSSSQLEAEPAEAFKDGLDAGFSVALDVSVVEAEDESSAGVAGIEPIEDKSARAAYVEVAGGRRGKTDAGSAQRGS